MYYYQFNLRDYLARTRHLSPMEDLAYRRMLDAYYTAEGALPVEPAKVARLIALPEQTEAVALVLEEFFSLTDEGWRNPRCDEEIAKFRAKSDRARIASDKRWHSTSDAKSNAKSIADALPTNNQEPKTKTKRAAKAAPKAEASEGFFDFWNAYPESCRINMIQARNAWNALSPDEELRKTIIDGLKAMAAVPDMQRDNYKYFPRANTFLTNERWRDAAALTAKAGGFNWDTLGD